MTRAERLEDLDDRWVECCDAYARATPLQQPSLQDLGDEVREEIRRVEGDPDYPEDAPLAPSETGVSGRGRR